MCVFDLISASVRFSLVRIVKGVPSQVVPYCRHFLLQSQLDAGRILKLAMIKQATINSIRAYPRRSQRGRILVMLLASMVYKAALVCSDGSSGML